MTERLLACSRPLDVVVAGLTCPGLMVIGDYALATGADSHVAHVGQRLVRTGGALAWVSMIPADRIALAAAIHRAWTHSDWVIALGGLGGDSDDHVRVTVDALQSGRVDVGLPSLPERVGHGFVECGNLVFFSGHPDRAHPALDAWLEALPSRSERGDHHSLESHVNATEFISWALPETDQSAAARARVKHDYPAVLQRVLPAGEGRVSLRLTGPSKSRTQAARKALQRMMVASSVNSD